MDPITAPAEFSRVYRVDDLPPGGLTVTLTADAAECAALARRFGLLTLDRLVVQAVLKPQPGQRGVGRSVRVEGSFEAEVQQECVVTLEPVQARIGERFDMVFADVVDTEAEAAIEVEAEDPPEPLQDGAFDLGEAVAEQVGLAIDPYPRAPGAVFEAPEGANAPRESPFAVLRGRATKS